MDENGSIRHNLVPVEQIHDLRILADIKKLNLQPADILVAPINKPLSAVDREGVMFKLQHAFPGYRCNVLDRGARLQVIVGADDAATR